MRERRYCSAHWVAVGGAVVTAACGGGEPAAGAGGGVRDTLPNGTPRISYSSLEAAEEASLVTADLRIGNLDGDEAYVFGDIRGIEADPSGEIYVLDYQAAEVRVFSSEGEHLRTLARRGEGPGELGDSNGFVLAGDTLFIYDHSKWVVMGLHRIDGDERVRLPTVDRSYGYVWRGTRDDRGRFWMPVFESDQSPSYPPEEGLLESSASSWFKVFDPATEELDSVYLGDVVGSTWVARSGGGYSYRGIPFQAEDLAAVDPSGGFWRVSTDRYRLARLSEAGDTTLVVDVAIEPRPVTDADRQAFLASVVERSPDDRRIAEEMLAVAPAEQPVIERIVVDPSNRLWVERTVPVGADPLWDVFTREGEYQGSVRLGFAAAEFFPPRIRDGRFYTLEQNALDVPFVVRAPLPSRLR